jgi:hypothetical protein
MKKRPLLESTGDPEQDARNRLEFLRKYSGSGVVYIPPSWVTKDPAMAQAVEELDWLQIETPRE